MVEIISHRGNMFGPTEGLENNPSLIEATAVFFKVEVDVRKVNGEYWLGHDKPEYKVSLEWLANLKDRLMLHCKDVHTYECDNLESFHRFMHDDEPTVLCSRGNILKHPDVPHVPDSYNMMPENSDYESYDTIMASKAVCTDFPAFIRIIKDEAVSIENDIS